MTDLLLKFPILNSILILLIASIISFIIRSDKIKNIIIIILSGINLLNIFYIYNNIQNAAKFNLKLFNIVDNFQIAFSVSNLGLIFAIIISILWSITYLYGYYYLKTNNEQNISRFFVFFHIALMSAMSLAFTDNLLSLFIFYEILTLSTYPLVAHQQNQKSKDGARIYLSILLSTSILLFLPALIILSFNIGNLPFRDFGILNNNIDNKLALILFFMLIFGVGKAAIMPIHKWLPAAMVAPTPVSALLHAVAVVKAGVFTIIKIVTQIYGIDYLKILFLEFPVANFLIFMAGFTIIAASIVALKQDNLKKRLAYSTISQLSYIILASLILNKYAIIGASFHIVAHAFSKITLFFVAGIIYTTSKKTNISQMNGFAKKMPIAYLAFFVGSLAMIAVPFTSSFISKYYMILGAIASDNLFVLLIIIASTILNASYFLPIIFNGYFKNIDESQIIKKTPLMMNLAILITSFITIYLFFKPELFLNLIIK